MIHPSNEKVVIEGYLRKKSNRNTFWSSRYFVLRDLEISYFQKEPIEGEKNEPVHKFLLQSGCTVSEIKQQYSRTKNRVLHSFKLSWPGAESKEDMSVSREGMAGLEHQPSMASIKGHEEGTHHRSSTPGQSFRYRSDMPIYEEAPTPAQSRQTSASSTGSDVTDEASAAKFGPFDGTEVLLQCRRDSLGSMMASQSTMYGLMSSIFEENETLQQLIRVKTSAATLKRLEESQQRAQQELNERKKKKKKLSKKGTAGIAALAVGGVAVGAATAGIGLAAALVVVGVSAAAGGGVAAYGASRSGDASKENKPLNSLSLGSDNEEDALRWKEALEKQIQLCEQIGIVEYGEKVRSYYGAGGGGPIPQTVLVGLDIWKTIDYWVSSDIQQGLRIFDPHPEQAIVLNIPVKRAELVIQSSPFETFMCIMSSPNTTLCGILESMRVVHTYDDHSDIIHVCLRPQYLAPTWTAPRDFCLSRFWKLDDSGNYTVFWDSVPNKECPPVAGYVRGELHGVFIVSPMRGIKQESDSKECLVTQILQIDPKGWMWHSYGYTSQFTTRMLGNMLDIRDVICRERFAYARPDGTSTFGSLPGTTGFERTSSIGANSELEGFDQNPAPMNPSMWAEPEGTSFSVRGPTYITDKIKTASPESLFYLITVDFFELPQPMKHIASHPQNRIKLAQARGPHPFIFMIQIMIPGPPYYCLCAYFTPVDPNIFEQDTPFTRIAKPFFFGDDDHFRDTRFKLIPQMIEANYVVKKATGNTPAIIGTKLKQHYFRGNNYFELDIDVASSSIAARITRLAVGYSKTVIVDIGFVLQGNTSEELPEHMMCAVRSKNLDVTHATSLT